MNRFYFSAAVLSLAVLIPQVQADIVASNDFDAPVNLISSSSSPVAFNAFSSGGDAWGIYDYATGGPFALFDDTTGVGGAAGTASGGGDPFVNDSLGIVQSTKTDRFFGISDTDNGDTGSTNGEMTGDFVFDISSTTGLTSVDIDFAAMGDFESADSLVVSYSIDGAAFADLFVSSVDEAGSKDYTMQDGDVVTLNDPMAMNGVELGNSFETISAALTGTGSELTLRFVSTTNGTEAMGFDSIVINGTIGVPEPSAFGVLAAMGLVALRRRNRKS